MTTESTAARAERRVVAPRGLSFRRALARLAGRLRPSDTASADDKLRHAEARYRTLVEQLPLVTYIDALTATASGLYASPQIQSLLGYTPEEWIQDPEMFVKLLHPDDRERVLALVERCNRTAEPFRSEYRLVRRDGRAVWVQDESLVVTDADGTPLFTQGYLLDVTERKEAEQRLRAEQGVARTLAEATSLDDATAQVASVVCDAFGWRSGELWLVELDGTELRSGSRTASRGEGVVGRAWELRRAVWEPRPDVGALAVPVLLGSEPLGVLEFVGVHEPDRGLGLTMSAVASQIAQFADRKRAEERLLHQALHDDLTGLPNRALFHDRVAQSIERSRRLGGLHAVLLMDLDGFKEVNDTLGHHSGDALLRELGERLLLCVRGSDTVARLGGDEFGFLLTDIEEGEVGKLVARIQQALHRAFVLQALPLQITASIGIALFPVHGDSVELLLQRADVAMYVAKRRRTGFAFYDPQTDDYTPTRLTLLGDLREALERGELTVRYQPRIELATGGVAAVEALLYWNHPTLGSLHPDDFLAAASRGGLMSTLTRCVVDDALARQLEWREAGHELTFVVNVSLPELLDPGFASQVLSVVEQAQGLVAFDVSEHAYAGEPARVEAVFRSLVERGIGVSVDDFGTGYSTLLRIRKLPLQALKLHRSFVRNMANDPEDAVVVRSAIELAHNLGLRVIAGSVDTPEIYERLVELGCDAVQGTAVVGDLSPAELRAWLDERTPAAK